MLWCDRGEKIWRHGTAAEHHPVTMRCKDATIVVRGKASEKGSVFIKTSEIVDGSHQRGHPARVYLKRRQIGLCAGGIINIEPQEARRLKITPSENLGVLEAAWKQGQRCCSSVFANIGPRPSTDVLISAHHQDPPH